MFLFLIFLGIFKVAKIAFIGGGNMSSCICKGIINTRPQQDEITVSGPHLEKLEHFQAWGCKITSDNVAAFNQADVVFFGVKPQVLPSVLEELTTAQVSTAGKLLISMAAGFTFKAFTKRLGQCKLIRIMPNTPAKLGLGVTSVCAGEQVPQADLDLCLSLLQGLGMTVPTDEAGINSLGALAGSAPAFLFRFMEALVAETKKAGFSEQQARAIIEQMALGTVQMVKNNPDTEISALREAVTSKGGTTYQGLQQMTNYQFEQMMSDAIAACLRRTHEFEQMFE